MLSQQSLLPPVKFERKLSVHHPTAVPDIARMVRLMSQAAEMSGKELVVLCIGTDRSTGDALGPLTGTKLRMLHHFPRLYGTLEVPVHATNLADTLNHIQISYRNPFIIAVDACLGKIDSIGCVSLGYGSVKPGAAVSKNLPAVGDGYITGIVNVGGFMEHMVLQSTRLNLVMKMADTIAGGLADGLTAT